MPHNPNSGIIGDIVEELVIDYLKEIGSNPERSTGAFDNSKDITFDKGNIRATGEIKGYHVIHVKDAFSIPSNQLPKCKDVDDLFLVELPDDSNNNQFILWKAKSKNERKFHKWKVIDNRQKYLIYINDMIYVTTLNPTQEQLDKFKRYNTSNASKYAHMRSKDSKKRLEECQRLEKKSLEEIQSIKKIESSNINHKTDDLNKALENAIKSAIVGDYNSTYEYIKQNFHPVLKGSDEPYLINYEVTEDRKWNPGYEQDKLCTCGHPYERHFDSYESNDAVGCKYCGCYHFEPLTAEFPDHGAFIKAQAVFKKKHQRNPDFSNDGDLSIVENYYIAIIETTNI